MAWQQTLVDAWTRRGLLAWSLRPLSWLYGTVIAVRRALYRRGLLLRAERVPVPVVVVGNVVAGGGGKTPLVIAMLRQMQSWGLHPGVVSRGYGRRGDDCREVGDRDTAQDVGDEPLLIARATGAPVAVAPRRIDAARHLLHLHPEIDVLVADDGLQHMALHRDVEVCVFDDRGVGNGWLLPAGPLREPWPRAVDLVVQTRASTAPGAFHATRRLASHAVRADGARTTLADLAEMSRAGDVRLVAVAGIAQPHHFFGMLRSEGLALTDSHALPDHAREQDYRAAGAETGLLLCTEKDATKLWPLRPDALAVPLELTVDPAFWPALRARIDAVRRAPPSPAPRL